MLTGLFLGAGASYEIGMPLVTELTAEFKNYWTPHKLRSLNVGWRLQGGGYADSLIDELASILQRPEMHYESILGYLEVQYTRYGSHQREYNELYARLIESVFVMLWARHVRNIPRLSAYLRYLEGIVGLAEANRPLWVFTLNHDLIVDCLGLAYGIPVSHGFPETESLPRRNAGGGITGSLAIEVLKREQFEKSDLLFLPHDTRGINLLKIHGGLDIFTFRDGKDLMRPLPLEPNPSGLIEALRIVEEELVFVRPSGEKARATNEIAYADDAGEMQFLRRTLLAGAFKFDARHNQVLPDAYLRMFEGYINYVSHLICIGYGFKDLHINAVIRKWLELTSERRLEIVSPGADSVPTPLLHLSAQVEVISAKATDYLERHVVKPLSPEERAFKDLCEQTRTQVRQ